VLQCFVKFSTYVHRLGQVKCCEMVWNIQLVLGWSRFLWYQVSTQEWRLAGIAIFPLKYTNGAHWIILVSKSGSLFVMHHWILLLVSCALEVTSNAIVNALSCSLNAKISLRNVDLSCGSLSFGRWERVSWWYCICWEGRQCGDHIPQQSITTKWHDW
jgi:hypothetical protein